MTNIEINVLQEDWSIRRPNKAEIKEWNENARAQSRTNSATKLLFSLVSAWHWLQTVKGATLMKISFFSANFLKFLDKPLFLFNLADNNQDVLLFATFQKSVQWGLLMCLHYFSSIILSLQLVWPEQKCLHKFCWIRNLGRKC